MRLTSNTGPGAGRKKIISGTDAFFLMIASAAAGVLTSVMAVSSIVALHAGPTTLTVPVATSNQVAQGLSLGASGHYTSLQATIPVLPAGPATLLTWAEVLNQIGILAILALVFLLAHRLRSEVLFTAGSARVVVACGVGLALAGTAGQLVDAIARSRLAELISANARHPEVTYFFSADFNVTPLALGLVLVLVAGVFQLGRRLQKDTEGLA